MYIYKIMSQADWQDSLNLGYIKKLTLDTKFIHMCSEEQITMIIEKFWLHEPNVIIAKIDPTKLIGRLVYESNPGGVNKYYHLYDGQIPLIAVVESFTATNDEGTESKVKTLAN